MVKEKLKKSMGEAIKKHKQGAVIMMELPVEQYFEASSASIEFLTKQGFDGLYISFQRPFENISNLLAQQGIDTEKLLFIDVATALGGETQVENPRCAHISPAIEIDELIRAIYTSLPRLKNKKKFIFVDSLTTISLYKPLSETLRLSEFLIRSVKNKEVDNIIFNVAKDLSQKRFIKDIALHVDEVIS